jgi:two-component system response regulator GlrR
MRTATLVGRSQVHRRLLEKLQKIANTDAEILISGPTGVGKERYALFVHQRSLRSAAPFVPINCGALPDELMENEFFGHVGGAFTGARPQSQGLVAEAEGGTLFLDEIDSLSLNCQVKLLRYLQDKQYRKLGETRIRVSDVRFIAATNTDLRVAIREGRFREDLYFRLRVVPVEVPPLRARPEDVPILLALYIRYYARAYELTPIKLSKEAKRRLVTYRWPGNIRELENCVRYLTCLQLCRDVEPADLPLLDDDEQNVQTAESSGLTEQSFREAKKQAVDRFERLYIEDALRKSNGNVKKAAQASHKARRAFFEVMRKHGINPADFHVDLASFDHFEGIEVDLLNESDPTAH